MLPGGSTGGAPIGSLPFWFVVFFTASAVTAFDWWLGNVVGELRV